MRNKTTNNYSKHLNELSLDYAFKFLELTKRDSYDPERMINLAKTIKEYLLNNNSPENNG